MSARKPATRAPTARDTRLREAMAALLEHGSARKASKACGIPYRTIGTWAASGEGKAVTDELRRAVGDDRAARIWKAADKYLARLEHEAADMPLGQVAIVYGILADKAARLTEKKDPTAGGAWVVSVKAGGYRVERSADGSIAEASAVSVSVTKSGGSE